MISMHGVSSSLIARNESWVRKQANALARRLPSNVEKADLIQAGLIAVAQSALGFEWEGDRDSDTAKEAFVRYARMRVKGAMIDELRQMDQLGRAERRKVKVIDIARERWRANHESTPSLAELSQVCGMSAAEIAQLDNAARVTRVESLVSDEESEDYAPSHQAATPADEVEARVDTAILMRRLEKFFVSLPERERQVIDAYLGVGLTPTQLADSWRVTPSRVSQLYKSTCQRIARHLGHNEQRAADRWNGNRAADFDEAVRLRESELANATGSSPWGELVEQALTLPQEHFSASHGETRLDVGMTTRWP